MEIHCTTANIVKLFTSSRYHMIIGSYSHIKFLHLRLHPFLYIPRKHQFNHLHGSSDISSRLKASFE